MSEIVERLRYDWLAHFRNALSAGNEAGAENIAVERMSVEKSAADTISSLEKRVVELQAAAENREIELLRKLEASVCRAAELEETLRFYANEVSWSATDGFGSDPAAFQDSGDLARAALGKEKQ